MRQGQSAEVTLGECVEVLTGFSFKSPNYTSDPDDVRLLRGDNVAQGCLRWDGVKRWRRDDVDSYARYRLAENDVVLAMDRPWIDAGLKWACVRRDDLPALLVQRVARMRGTNGLDSTYLRYVIAGQSFTEYVKSITTGANVPHISGPDIRKYRFRLPSPLVQRRIADILSAYDDLIENNAKRIRILEEIARSLYREWFVNFRFPGHEKVKMVSSPLGKVPEGWAATLGEALTLQRGFDLPERDRRSGAIPIVSSSGTTGFHDVAKVAPPGVVTGRYGTLGEVYLVDQPFWPLNTTLFVKEFKGNSPYWILYQLRALNFARENAAGAVPGVNRNALHLLPIILPTKTVQQHFDSIVVSMHEQIRVMTALVELLQTTRDLLLPRLISGEVSVAADT